MSVVRYLSLFSGIEAATVAWAPLGWECVAVAEIEPFPCALLAEHYPGVPNLGDVTKITATQIALLGHIDVVIFGSPCQDLSVAGKRKGLQDGTRSNLFFAAMQIVQWCKWFNGTRFTLWENVPGVFTTNQGRDFAAVVESMAGLTDVAVPANGWGTEGCAVGDDAMLEWAVLDAQWFGVAQRRRRVFAVADFGDWTNRPPILLEPHSLRGNTAPSREAGESVARTIASRTNGGGFPGTDEACDGYVQPCAAGVTIHGTNGTKNVMSFTDIAGALRARMPSGVENSSTTVVAVALRGRDGGATAEVGDDVMHALRAGGGGGDKPHVMCMTHGQGGAEISVGRSPTLTCVHEAPIVVHGTQDPCVGDVAFALQQNSGQENAVCVTVPTGTMQVRRLIPKECERLQGFPDNHTAVTYRNKPAADGPRYKAIGNSMAVPVIRHIGEKLQMAFLFSGHCR